MGLDRAALPDKVQALVADILACLRFCTRLPIGTFAFEKEPFRPLGRSAVRAFPLAGALIGCCGAGCILLATKLGFPSPLPALLTLAALILLTGALHEDGLGDCADAFGGGNTREARLAILKDPRLGTFGTLALITSFMLRASSLAAVTAQSLVLACLVLIAIAGMSRGMALLPLWLLPPARAQGAGLSAADPSAAAMGFAMASAALLALLPACAGASMARCIAAFLATIAGASIVTLIARRAIGGQTGDVAGAAQQIAEICAYLVFSAVI
jgi:adenosylcobinamide-GDP ribazoletransferase